MSIPPRDTSKKGTVTRSQKRKNPSLAKEVEESSQLPLKPKRKNQENTAKDSHHSETSNISNQGDLLDIIIGSISDAEISTSNKTKTPNSPFFNKLKTFIRPSNSIIIARDKYNDTRQINQSFDDTIRDITLREESIFKNVTANSTLYDRTLCAQENSIDISNNKVPALPREGYEFIDPFSTKSQFNRTPEFLNQTTIFNNPNLEFSSRRITK